MRGRNTRTDNPPRVSFYFIVKRDIEIFVWFVEKTKITILPVGVGALDDPRTYGSPPHIRLSSFLIVGVDVLDDPRSLRSQTKPLSVAEMLGLQKPSPVGEHVAKRLSSLQANVEGTACGG
jgi:hypothetical protein